MQGYFLKNEETELRGSLTDKSNKKYSRSRGIEMSFLLGAINKKLHGEALINIQVSFAQDFALCRVSWRPRPVYINREELNVDYLEDKDFSCKRTLEEAFNKVEFSSIA